MLEGMDQAAIAELIKKLAHSLKLWCTSIDHHTGDTTEPEWWLGVLTKDVLYRGAWQIKKP